MIPESGQKDSPALDKNDERGREEFMNASKPITGTSANTSQPSGLLREVALHLAQARLLAERFLRTAPPQHRYRLQMLSHALGYVVRGLEQPGE